MRRAAGVTLVLLAVAVLVVVLGDPRTDWQDGPGEDTPTTESDSTQAKEERVTRPDHDPPPAPLPDPEGDFVVRVTEADGGDPVSGAQVRLDWGGVAEREHTTTTTRSDGRAGVSVTECGGALTVSMPGFLQEQRPISPQQPNLVVELVRAGRVRGRVVDAQTNAPLAGVPVYGVWTPDVYSADLENDRRGISRADGTYELDDLQPGVWMVFALGEGRASVDLGRVDYLAAFNPLAVYVHAAGEVARNLATVPAAAIRGVVVDAGGKPVARARVNMWTGRDTWGGFADRLGVATTGADGRFVFSARVPGAPTRVGVLSDAHLRETADVTPENEPLRIVLSDARPLRITVLDEAGEAIDGARIQLSTPQTERLGDSFGPFTTGADGTVSAGGVPNRELEVSIRKTGYVPLRAQLEETDGTALAVEYRLAAGRSVEGRVTLPTGVVHITDASVQGKNDPQSPGYMDRRGTIDEDLQFRVSGLPDARTLIEVNARAGPTRLFGDALVDAGATDVEIVLAARRAEPRVDWAARVVGPDGEPVYRGSARVSFRSGRTWQTHEVSVFDGIIRMPVATDTPRVKVDFWDAAKRDGTPLPYARSIVDDLPTASREPAPGAAAASSSDTSLATVRVAREALLAGRVLDAAGAPVAGIGIAANSLDDAPGRRPIWRIGQVWTDEDGRFRIPGLYEGRFRLTVYGDYAEEMYETGRDDYEIRPPGEGDFVVVRVVGPDGGNIEDADVWAHRVGTQYHAGRIDWGSTDVNGLVRLDGLTAGKTYALYVTPPYREKDLAAFEVDRWVAADGPLSMPRGYVYRGRVVDAEGTGLPGVDVWVRAKGGPWRRTDTGASGAFSIGKIVGTEAEAVVAFEPVHDQTRLDARPSTTIRVDQPATLSVETGAVLLFHVEGFTPPMSSSGLDVRVLDRETAQIVQIKWSPANGGHTLEGLVPGRRYDIYLHERRRMALLTDVGPGDPVVKVKPGRNGAITGRVLIDGKPAIGWGEVQAVGGAVLSEAQIMGNGRFKVERLPPGVWTLNARFRRDGTTYRGSAVARMGESVDIEVRPE